MGDEVCKSVSAEHPAVMLAFSGGKDSIAAWLAMRPYFSRIVPVYYYSGQEALARGLPEALALVPADRSGVETVRIQTGKGAILSKNTGRAANPDELDFGGPGLDMGAGLNFDDTGGGLFNEGRDDSDPIGEVDYPGNFVGDTKADVDAISSAFMNRAKAEAARFRAATDSEYWFCTVFETREQKERFIQAMGWAVYGADKYLDGLRLAEHHKIALPSGAHVPYVKAKPDMKLNTLAMPLED